MTVKKTGRFPVFLTVMVLFLSFQREKTENFPCRKYDLERLAESLHLGVTISVICGFYRVADLVSFHLLYIITPCAVTVGSDRSEQVGEKASKASVRFANGTVR